LDLREVRKKLARYYSDIGRPSLDSRRPLSWHARNYSVR
jgi:hypothetical protein